MIDVRLRLLLLAACCTLAALPSAAQTANPLTILRAEARGAPTAGDLAVLRAGVRSRDPEIARIAVRALGRLERPSLISGLLPSLRHSAPEVRAAAANAIGQAAQGARGTKPDPALKTATQSLRARLALEEVPAVRAAILETLARLPYATSGEAREAARSIVADLGTRDGTDDRLAIAQGLETFVRAQQAFGPPDARVIAALVELSTPREDEATSGARVRRLALEGLIAAGAAAGDIVQQAAADPDAQVRRLAMKLAALPAPSGDPFAGVVPVAGPAAEREQASKAPAQPVPAFVPAGETSDPPVVLSRRQAALVSGMIDTSPMVRLEAARALYGALGGAACPFLVGASKDADAHVALMAIDRLAACRALPDAMAVLERAVADVPAAGSARGWHRTAHAIVALASALPAKAAASLPAIAGARAWPLRMYAARAAAVLRDRAVLERLAADPDDNVSEAAIAALSETAGHAADQVYVAALARGSHQVVRAAALALAGTPDRGAAAPALARALERLIEEGTDNGADPRQAVADALASIGSPVPAPKPGRGAGAAAGLDVDAAALQRLAAPRARISVRGVGSFEIALLPREAPGTVVQFARLAEAGYYHGLTFHRIVPNMAVQGGSPGANEYVGYDRYMRDELGLWPHVRGAVGLSTRGRDTGDAQIFIDTVDNPRFDHEYTVFAQVLNGIDVVDLILEGDVIESVEIIP
ncbi:MAG: peptidylprolyl isomerase [Acidobacteria bacterium]|nr:peptidylprolyl isomerase [Acidobacteriota bacterium]